MINKILVEATVKAFKTILEREGVPYDIRSDAESKYFMELWEDTDEDRNLAYRQALPAVERIAEKEPFLFVKDGDPLVIRLNYLDRELERDSFGEILLERPDKDWRFSISIKDDANVLTTMPLADRTRDNFMDHVNVSNEIDDFGDRIFGVPCSNEYFDEVNDILQRIDQSRKEAWAEKLTDDDFVYDNIITPMLGAMGREFPRIFEYHPEAPKKLLDYFYGTIDYYFLKPIKELEITRIGAVNAHGGLGCIPNNRNHYVPVIVYPTKLFDVRFATGKYGELSKDTLQLAFDGGWSICINIHTTYTEEAGRFLGVNVYLPVTPFGSYRDQVAWSDGK